MAQHGSPDPLSLGGGVDDGSGTSGGGERPEGGSGTAGDPSLGRPAVVVMSPAQRSVGSAKSVGSSRTMPGFLLRALQVGDGERSEGVVPDGASPRPGMEGALRAAPAVSDWDLSLEMLQRSDMGPDGGGGADSAAAAAHVRAGSVGADEKKTGGVTESDVVAATTAEKQARSDQMRLMSKMFQNKLHKRDMLVLEFVPDGSYRFREMTRMDIIDAARVPARRESIEDDAALSSGIARRPSPSKRGRRSSGKGKAHKNMLLQLRDLRSIDPAFASSSSAALKVRQHAILLNAVPIRALILADKCFLFLVGEAEYGADSMIETIMKRLRRPPDDPDLEPPFCFKALEALLITVCASMEETISDIAQRVDEQLSGLSKGANVQQLNRLRLLKREVTQFLKRHVSGIQKAIALVLDDPVDLRLMDLEKHDSEEGNAGAQDAAEMLLESYLAEVETVMGRAEDVEQDIESSERQAMLLLDISRNRLHKLEIFFTLLAACMGAGSFVVGVFGMNLRNTWEDSNEAFIRVSWITAAAVSVVALLVTLVLLKADI